MCLHENPVERLPACLTRRVRGRRWRFRCLSPRSGSNRDHLNTRRFGTSIIRPIYRPVAPCPPVAKTPIIWIVSIKDT